MDDLFLKALPVAHRGLHGETVPENSMSAFRAAAKAGYAIETDVRLSKDDELVLFHDDTLARMTGVNRRVEELTAAELKELSLAGTGERIPLLSEFASEIEAPLLLEIKNMPKADGKYFMWLIATGMDCYRGAFAVQSFNPFYVKEFKKLCPDVPCGVLAAAQSTKEDFDGSLFWRIKARAVKNMSFNRSVKPDFISYRFDDYPQPSTEKFQGIKLGWTVRSEKDEALARRYCDNIIFENYLPKL